MTNYLLRSLTPQSVKVYKILLKTDKLTASEIAKSLNILPHAVYRSIKQLIELGFVKKLNIYPTTYDATDKTDALNLYQMVIRENFASTFGSGTSEQNKPLDISFIQKRKELLELTNADMEMTKKSADFIVSGLEVPAETVLGYKRAVERGVKIRVLIQELNEKNKTIFRNWQKMGIQVRYFPDMEARIFIFDNQIVYFTSYSPKNKEEALGTRFNYAPFAQMVREMFEMRWELGKKIV